MDAGRAAIARRTQKGTGLIFRFLSALLRSGVVFFLIAFPSSVLAPPGVGGLGSYVIFAMLAATIVFFEYASHSPSLIEFRHAPPYNRFRILVFGLTTMFIILNLNLNSQTGPIFDIVGGVSRFASWLFQNRFSPVYALINILNFENNADLMEFQRLAEVALFVSFFLSIFFCFVIWMQKWPLSGAGFNLWPNMPTFHASAGSRTEVRMLQIAILSFAMAVALPYLFPMVLQMLKAWLSIDYSYQRHSAFWIIMFWTMMPAMAMMRGLVLLKVAYLARELRSMNARTNEDDD